MHSDDETWRSGFTPWRCVPWWAFWRRMIGHKWYRWVDHGRFHSEWDMEFASDHQLAQIYLEENFGDA